MKAKMILAALALCAVTAVAKEIRTLTVTTDPVMHCENCEKKIKNYFRFEKGVKRIDTSVPEQRVTITYDADKTSEQKLLDGFGQIDYDVTVIEPTDSIAIVE